ncbi:MAG TPA: hypothetical protein VIK18_06015 [Pirellulales bacterium]
MVVVMTTAAAEAATTVAATAIATIASTLATTATGAAVTGHSRIVLTADQGDAHHREKNRDAKS